MKAWKVILAVIVIFCAGAVTGGLTIKVVQNRARATPAPTRMAIHEPGWMQRFEFLKRLQRQLDLAPQQRERIEALLSESQERMKAIWEPLAPQAQAEFKNVREAILKELTPAQKQKFEELSKLRSQHNRERPEANDPAKKRERRAPEHSDTNTSTAPPVGKAIDSERR